MLNYTEAIEYIHSTYKFGSKLGLENIKELLNRLGNPQNEKKIIHIAGTNGKGSTSAMISYILSEQGNKVGLYTSPYLEEFNERIKINNNNISNQKLAYIIEKVKISVDEMVSEGFNHPTEFEIITAAAFLFYDLENVDFIVLEVGLGGRFDATNVIESPLLTILTSISMDHMQYLGDTLEKIAFEKCGIIKPQVKVVVASQHHESMKIIKEQCAIKSAECINSDDAEIITLGYNIYGQDLLYKYKNNEISFKLSLLGEYQISNVKTVLTAIYTLKENGIRISSESIKSGLKNVKWPGRFEIINKNPMIVLDGAHNEEGIIELKKALKKYFPTNNINIVLGILKDKQYKEMVKTISDSATNIIATEPDNDRKLSAFELATEVSAYNKNVSYFSDYKDAVNNALKSLKANEVLCIAGSLYLIGVVKKYLREGMKT